MMGWAPNQPTRSNSPEPPSFSHDHRSYIHRFARVGSRSAGCGSAGSLGVMDTIRRFDLFGLWRWTLELFALVLVACYWGLLFSDSVWGTKFRYHYLLQGSLPVMGLLLITASLCWRQHRRHGALGFIICLAWLIWAALPRI